MLYITELTPISTGWSKQHQVKLFHTFKMTTYTIISCDWCISHNVICVLMNSSEFHLCSDSVSVLLYYSCRVRLLVPHLSPITWGLWAWNDPAHLVPMHACYAIWEIGNRYWIQNSLCASCSTSLLLTFCHNFVFLRIRFAVPRSQGRVLRGRECVASRKLKFFLWLLAQLQPFACFSQLTLSFSVH
jgi:hypothetical protein